MGRGPSSSLGAWCAQTLPAVTRRQLAPSPQPLRATNSEWSMMPVALLAHVHCLGPKNHFQKVSHVLASLILLLLLTFQDCQGTKSKHTA